jgi:hypothetical protein
MTPPDGSLGRRRCFFLSGLVGLGWVLPLGLVATLSGCSDDKSEGQVKAVDVTKTRDAMDSMNAYKNQMKNRKQNNR